MNVVIEKLEKKDLKEAISIYDENHSLKTNYEKLLAIYEDIYNNKAYHNIVAKINGKIVGLATIIINYDYTKYMKELEKTKTRSLTTFYFNDRNNKDFQEYEGKQYNANYEFGGIITKYDEEKSVIEIKNKLKVGDEMEIIIPNQIEPVVFKIEQLWDEDTDEEITCVNPGRAGQCVKMKLPVKCEENWVIRRKK